MKEVYCKDCGKMYEEGAKFYQNIDGTILCKECFDKRVSKGDIK